MSMARKRSTQKKVQFSTRKLKRLSPWKALGIVGLLVLIGFIALAVLKILVYAFAIAGLVYVIYLFFQKRR
jgi:4-hydroxybenzoate polyprenyltransferase